MIKTQKVVRFEQALRVWEDTCFIPATILKYGDEQMKKPYKFERTGAVVNYHKLRTALIKTSEPFNIDDYLGSNAFAEYIAELFLLPLHLFLWTRTSRRLFQLSPDMQTLLSAISLERVTWDMLNLPFESFAINLPEPLDDGLGWKFDCIFIADVTDFMVKMNKVKKGKRVLQYSLFSKNLDKAKTISLTDKKRFKRAVVGKNYNYLEFFAKKYFSAGNVEDSKEISNSQNIRTGNIEFFENETVSGTFFKQEIEGKSMSDDSYQRLSVIEKALHQVVVLCLYLDSLKSSERNEVVKKIQSNDNDKKRKDKSISDASEVFDVKCEHCLSSEEKDALDGIRQIRRTDSVCVHWRRGYCRRMPGSGNDPNAPKLVIVKPTLVNAKFLKPDTLPVGSKSMVV